MNSKTGLARISAGRCRAERAPAAIACAVLLAASLLSGCGGKISRPAEIDKTITLGQYSYRVLGGFAGATYLSITQGSLYVSYEAEGQIRAYFSGGDPIPGNLVGSFTGLSRPTVIGTSGYLLAVVDRGDADTVKVYGLKGGAPLLTFRDPDWVSISALAVDDSGDIYVADAAKDFVRAYRPDGRPRFEVDLADSGFGIGHVMAPAGVTLDAGTMLISEAHAEKAQVQRIRTDRPQTGIPFSATIPLLRSFTDAEGNDIPLSRPIGVAAGTDSSIFVLDQGLNMILQYDDAGNSIAVVNSPQSGGPSDLAGTVSINAYNRSGIPPAVYVLDKVRGVIHRWDPKQ